MKTTVEDNTKMLVAAIVDGIREKKGKNISILDMRGVDDAICDYMVIGEGNTPIQVDAIEDSIWDIVHSRLNEKPIHEHKGVGEWIAMDYSDVIVHLFIPELRSYYNIEGLWSDADIQFLPDEE
ncbi:ribosome silencing factor [Porphyromonadaceae bacterium W3.11]|nr:ribosome silencing factor [Porphyromonadaceae bacterium W3.11]